MDGTRFAEVQYYFMITVGGADKTVALVSLYSLPDPARLANSFGTNISCTYEGDARLCVIDIKSIKSVVAMIPRQGRMFVVEKMGLDIAHLGGLEEDLEV